MSDIFPDKAELQAAYSNDANEVEQRAGDLLRRDVLLVLFDYSDGEIGNDEAVDKIIALFP